MRRDELQAKAEWLQEHGYYRGVSIIQLVDMLEAASENTYPISNTSSLYNSSGIADRSKENGK